MTWRRLRLAASVSAVALLGWSACSRPSAERDAARCRAVGGGDLSSSRLSVLVESRLEPDGGIVSGRVPSCDAAPRATRVFLRVTEAISAIPPALRPARVTMHFSPRICTPAAPINGVEYHAPTGSVLVSGEIKHDVDRGVWLHELAHLMMRGPRPRARLSRRFVFALEEGVADYFAAAVTGSPRIGDRSLDPRAERDLSRPPPMTALHWAAFGLTDAPFDSHDYGWSLAARLHQQQSSPGPLLEDLLRCFSNAQGLGRADDSTGELLAALLQGCPERSRARIERILRSWLPSELLSGYRSRASGRMRKGKHS
jgi:hypothetical protein